MFKKIIDDELLSIIVMVIIFGGALLGVDIWYSDWPGMFDTPLYIGGILAILANSCVVAAAFVSFKEWEDPKFDIARKWFCVLAVVTLLYVGAFRAAKNEKEGVFEGVKKEHASARKLKIIEIDKKIRDSLLKFGITVPTDTAMYGLSN